MTIYQSDWYCQWAEGHPCCLASFCISPCFFFFYFSHIHSRPIKTAVLRAEESVPCGPIRGGVCGKGQLDFLLVLLLCLLEPWELEEQDLGIFQRRDLGLRASDFVLRRCFPIILKTPIHPNEILLRIKRPQWTRFEYRSTSTWLAWSPSSVIYLPHGLGRVLNPLCDPSPLLSN